MPITKIIEFLTSNIKFIIALYIVIIIVLLFSTDVQYSSDSFYYFKLAEESNISMEYYPAEKHRNEDFIVSPFYINIIQLVLLIHNSTAAVSCLNLVLIILQLFLLFRLVRMIFSTFSARLTILLYLLYLNTAGLVLLNLTELLFVLIITAGLYFFTLQKKLFLFLAGFCFGISIAVRPPGWAFLISVFILQIFFIVKEKKFDWKKVNVYAGAAVFIILFGLFGYFHFEKFIFTSTTGPVNLLLGANDDATGGFNSTVYEKGKAGYIENPEIMTYEQKGEFYFRQAVSWIKENPERWIALMPLKILHTFGWDDIAVGALFNFQSWNFARTIKNIFSREKEQMIVPTSSSPKSISYIIVQVINHLYYYILLVIFILSIIGYLKDKVKNCSINLILLSSLISIMVIMVTVGTPRYKYHIVILLLPLASAYLEKKLSKSRKTV